jgi:hypothetical protein
MKLFSDNTLIAIAVYASLAYVLWPLSRPDSTCTGSNVWIVGQSGVQRLAIVVLGMVA